MERTHSAVVSSMMSCNENSRALRVQRLEEVNATGADIMLTSCPKCVPAECLKFEGDPKHDLRFWMLLVS